MASRVVVESSEFGNLAAAEAAYRQAIELLPGDADLHRRLAVVLHRGGEPDAALLEVDRAIALDATDPTAHILRSHVLAVLGKEDERRRAWATAVELAGRRCEVPEPHPAHLYMLAYCLADDPDVSRRKLEEAVALTRRGVKGSPEEAFARSHLAFVLLRAGKEDEAIEIVTDLRERCDGPLRLAGLDLMLARAHARLGRHEVARKLLDRAGAWIDAHVPKDPVARRSRAEIEALLAGKGR